MTEIVVTYKDGTVRTFDIGPNTPKAIGEIQSALKRSTDSPVLVLPIANGTVVVRTESVQSIAIKRPGVLDVRRDGEPA